MASNDEPPRTHQRNDQSSIVSELDEASPEETVRGQDNIEAKNKQDATDPPVPENEAAATASEVESDAVSGFPLVAILVGVCVGSFLMSLDIFIIATAIPAITAAFGVTDQIAWYAAAYSLTTCAIVPLAGKLASVFPLRWVYQIFFLIFLVGSVICGAAPTSNTFIVGRAIAGVGAAGVASGGLTIVVTVSKPSQRPLFMGLASSMFALGIILGPIIGGVFTEKVSWRWCFYVNLPTGLVTLLSMFFFFRPRQIHADRPLIEKIKSLDITGSLIFVPACFMLLIAMQWGGTRYPWRSAIIIGQFVGGGVLSIIFAAWQWYMGDNALIPSEVVGRRNVALPCIFAFCVLGSLSVMSYYLPEWFQAVQGVGPLQSGVRVLPSVIAQIISLLVVGGTAVKLRYYPPWAIVGSVLMAVAAGLFTTFKAFDTPSREWIGYQVIQGIGVGITMQIPTLMIQQALDGHPMLAVGVSMGLFSQYLGATVNQVIAGSVLNAYLRSSLHSRGLSPQQIAQLRAAGMLHVKETAMESFPELLDPVLKAYNYAITRVYFVPVVSSGIGLAVALGIKWQRIRTSSDQTTSSAPVRHSKEDAPQPSAV